MAKRIPFSYYIAGGFLLAFILLAILVSTTTLPFDRAFSLEIQEHRNPFLDIVMRVVSWPGYRPQSIVLPLSAALVFFLFGKKREAIFLGLTLLSGVLSRLLKILIDRPRPTDDLVRVIDKAQYQSFPSGHVFLYVVFFGFLIVLMNTLKDINIIIRLTVSFISAFFILAIPFSRIYLGAHWFSDVLGSVMLGSLYLFLLSSFYLKKSKS